MHRQAASWDCGVAREAAQAPTDWLGSTPSKLSRGCFKVFSKLFENEKVHKEEEKLHRHPVHRLASCLSSRLLPSHLNRLLSLALLSVYPLSLGRRLFSLCKSHNGHKNGPEWPKMGAKWSRNGGRSETKLHMAPPPLHLRLHPSAY